MTPKQIAKLLKSNLTEVLRALDDKELARLIIDANVEDCARFDARCANARSYLKAVRP
jgi:hypothetical protein